jgi:hypothetical protein
MLCLLSCGMLVGCCILWQNQAYDRATHCTLFHIKHTCRPPITQSTWHQQQQFAAITHTQSDTTRVSTSCGSNNATVSVCLHAQTTIFGRILMSKPGINYYDIRKQCEGPLCYDFSDADQFLNSAAVKKALGVKEEQQWQECNMLVNAQFYGGWAGLLS